MYLMMMVLDKQEYLNQVLRAFVDIGIHGATVIESTGMGRSLADTVPIFGGLRYIMEGGHPYNRTIFSLVDNLEQVESARKAVEAIVGSLDNPGTGVLFAMQVDRAYGVLKDGFKKP